jgi:hypothetical protein
MKAAARGKLPKPREGVLYRVRYRRQSGNYRWAEYEFQGKFLGFDSDGLELSFSLRPEAGTSSIKASDILEMWEMSQVAKPKLPVRIGGLDKPDE